VKSSRAQFVALSDSGPLVDIEYAISPRRDKICIRRKSDRSQTMLVSVDAWTRFIESIKAGAITSP
jgi:hypothetical protein